MENIIYILRDYPETVIFLSLVGIFLTGVYIGKLERGQR